MKKIILFSIVFLLLSVLQLNTMDRPGNKHDEFHNLVMSFLLKNTPTNLTQIEQFIIDNRIDVNRADPIRPSVLYIAINYGCLPLVKLLIKYGANIFQLLPNGNIPFKTAYLKAINQNDETDQIQMNTHKKPEFKKVFLFLLTCILQNENLFNQAMNESLLTIPLIEFAIPLAIQNNERELSQILQRLLETLEASSESD